MDDLIQSLLRRCLEFEKSWLVQGFDRILRVNASRAHSPYGFEWFIQTSVAAYLLIQTTIPLASVRIGLKEADSSNKPDISFSLQGKSVVIQVKSVGDAAERAYQQSDVSKQYTAEHVYLLVVCYPSGTLPVPEADWICSVTGPCGFLWVIRKIK